MHPLLYDTGHLTDQELDDKIISLNRKYWQTNNPQVHHQISIALESYKLEQEQRRVRQKIEQENGDNDLDNLINVS